MESQTLTTPNPSSGVETFPHEVFEAQSFLRNNDPRNLVAPLRQAKFVLADTAALPAQTARELQQAVLLQDQWEALLAERELLRNDIQRGREGLNEVRRDLITLWAQLAEWPAYERICGHNPLPDLVQSISVRERIEEFLPGWIARREDQLATLNLKMEACAQNNGLAHLL
jgi:hypothetical protein